jgi:integrase
MARKLTAIAVDNAKPKKGEDGKIERKEISDGGSGLYLIVQPSGAKSWAVRYRIAGKSKKHTLGDGVFLSLAAARVAATQALEQIDQGADPTVEKRKAKATSAEQEALRAQDGVPKLFNDFIELHAKRKLRANTLAQYQSIGRRFIVPPWRDRTVHDIRKRDIIAMIDPIAVDRPIMANRTQEVGHKFFEWLVARDVIAANPFAGLAMPGVERQRERFLNDSEVAQLWGACDGDPIFGAAIRVMLLTGCRRSEVAEMTRSEINADARVWTIPAVRSKNRKPHTVPLSTLAWKIIDAAPRIKGSDHVFSTSGQGPIANFHHVKDRLDAKLNFAEPWVIHDLRRTVASGLQRLKVRLEVTESVLGHRSGSFRGIVGVYQQHDYAEEKADALQRWADHIEQLITGKSAKIVRFKGNARPVS